MLVSAIRQHESAIDIHISPPSYCPSHLPPPPFRLSQSTRFELPASHSKFPLAIYFTWKCVCFKFVPPFPLPTTSTSLLAMSASPLLPCKQVHQSHLSRFHIYALTYDICFSLSDMLQSVWYILVLSSLYAWTQTCSFLWLSSIPLDARPATSLPLPLFCLLHLPFVFLTN